VQIQTRSQGLDCNKSHRTLAKLFDRKAYVAATATYTGPTARLAMPTSTLPTSSISPIYNDASEIYMTTPVKSTFSQEIEKVQKHAVQLADMLRQVTAKHQSNIWTDATKKRHHHDEPSLVDVFQATSS
jgi:hypothetical protein